MRTGTTIVIRQTGPGRMLVHGWPEHAPNLGSGRAGKFRLHLSRGWPPNRPPRDFALFEGRTPLIKLIRSLCATTMTVPMTRTRPTVTRMRKLPIRGTAREMRNGLRLFDEMSGLAEITVHAGGRHQAGHFALRDRCFRGIVGLTVPLSRRGLSISGARRPRRFPHGPGPCPFQLDVRYRDG